MKMQKCDNGHIYDGDKFLNCPKCSGVLLKTPEQKPSAKQVDTKQPDEEQKKNYARIARRKIVGMLLCMNGKMQGEGFFLVEGTNDIGRSSRMDLALVEELSVSRQVHATIVCEGLQAKLQLQNTKGYVAVNGEAVEESRILEDRDRVLIGKCELMYIATGINWSQEKAVAPKCES